MRGKERGMKRFEVRGMFTEKGAKKKFTKIVDAGNENMATEKVMSLIGSNHKTKRRDIFIEELKEVQDDGRKVKRRDIFIEELKEVQDDGRKGN